MEYSDEEGEIFPELITNYYFTNDKGEPISFSVLPLKWSNDGTVGDSERHVFLRGTYDGGLQMIYKRVISWKLELSFGQPEISVLSKDKNWITLQKPRAVYKNIIKTLMITIHWLHFLKKNHEASRESIWAHLMKTFRSFDVKPSENDLLDHITLITETAEKDNDLANSQHLLVLMENIRRNEPFHRETQTPKKLDFIDDNHENEAFDGEDNWLYDTVCAICDNGGDILCCEGRCLRSFHAVVGEGSDSLCETLGYTRDEVKVIPNFLCKNCEYQQHQCFVCGVLGSSDKSSGTQVFPCVSATCGYFYHPECVAKLNHPFNQTQADELRKKIAAGESYMCPVHKCYVCKKGEDNKVHDLQFAMCRRCPKSYHRKCLPKEIVFAWEGLLPCRMLIYCTDHDIIKELGTPIRNHLRFPDVEGKKWKSTKEKVLPSRSVESEHFSKRKVIHELPKQVKKVHSSIKVPAPPKILWTQERDSSRQPNMTDGGASRKILKINTKPVSRVPSIATSSGLSSKSDSPVNLQRHSFESLKEQQASSSRPFVNIEMENRILELMKKSTSSFDSEEFKKSRNVPSLYSYSSNSAVDKVITLGKVEGSVQAIRTAIAKLEEGCSNEDAKAVCEPEILHQIYKWKRKLKIYLGPFLHGRRYTSFGRHFTKLDKLKEVVDRLKWYLQNGDMIVDFCCGSNDFSCLMKEELEEMGKYCLYKNYDLFQPKKDFCFERKDWFTVKPEELPNGSQLVMGLNPPFGVKAAQANIFIEKALEFKPKLLILIAPRETKRLDRRANPYDLVWEDDQMFSGKSFYLPGSVDVHNKQLDDWNLKPPPLYLWSRPDWTSRHREIAQEQGHIPKGLGTETTNYLMEEKHDCYQVYTGLCAPDDIASILDGIPEDNVDDIECWRNESSKEPVSKTPMELCSPTNSPIDCSELQSLLEERLL